MLLRIETIVEKKMLGKNLEMSLIANKTHELWRSFMAQRKEIKNSIGTDLYSLQVYDKTYFEDFNPNHIFKKWALIEVQDWGEVPNDMIRFALSAGQYAVFNHKGDVADFMKLVQYIHGVWLPNSDYVLDDRPHFELLGEKYKNGDSDSEEEIWIPIKSNIK
jgi:AraC family transcriptional regulator